MSNSRRGSGSGSGNGDKALLVLAASAVVWFGFETLQLLNERSSVSDRIDAQAQAVESGRKLAGQLETLAGATAALADTGNQNAKAIVDAFRAKGVGLHVPGATPTSKPADTNSQN